MMQVRNCRIPFELWQATTHAPPGLVNRWGPRYWFPHSAPQWWESLLQNRLPLRLLMQSGNGLRPGAVSLACNFWPLRTGLRQNNNNRLATVIIAPNAWKSWFPSRRNTTVRSNAQKKWKVNHWQVLRSFSRSCFRLCGYVVQVFWAWLKQLHAMLSASTCNITSQCRQSLTDGEGEFPRAPTHQNHPHTRAPGTHTPREGPPPCFGLCYTRKVS